MRESRTPLTILIADDDPGHRLTIRQAFEEARVINPLRFVEDGEELLEYLCCRGTYAAADSAPFPGLILLDLKMQGTDGRKALREIKNHPELKDLPVVVLTASRDEEDFLRTCDLGVDLFITKPITFSGLVKTVKPLCQCWFAIVTAPGVEFGGLYD